MMGQRRGKTIFKNLSRNDEIARWNPGNDENTAAKRPEKPSETRSLPFSLPLGFGGDDIICFCGSIGEGGKTMKLRRLYP